MYKNSLGKHNNPHPKQKTKTSLGGTIQEGLGSVAFWKKYVTGWGVVEDSDVSRAHIKPNFSFSVSNLQTRM